MKWTAHQDATLRRLYPDLNNEVIAQRMCRSYSSIMNRAIKLRLRKSAAFMASPVCRFQKGQTPWNLGKTGYMGANRTSFKKGDYSRRWDREQYPVGALRLDARDNRVIIKLADGQWTDLARYVWTTEKGPIPEGMTVRAKNGDAHDTRIGNLKLVSRADLMRENSYHRLPKELANLIQLRVALNRQINKRSYEQHR
jgi:hypothetical protein